MAKYKHPNWRPSSQPKRWEKSKKGNSAENPVTKQESVDYQKEFMRKFKTLVYRYSPFSVWSDFVTMAACSVSNAFDKTHFEDREELYHRVIAKYNEKERMIFPELLALTAAALDENPEQDFLGGIFISLGIFNEHLKQHFTPYDVSRVAAELTMQNIADEVKQRGAVTINDPCCGSGGMLIASVNHAKRELSKVGLNYQDYIFVSAQDIDTTVAFMCYIQLSLLGVSGYVKVGDTLTDPISPNDCTDNYWFTPMYFSNIWHTRRMLSIIMQIMGDDEDG